MMIDDLETDPFLSSLPLSTMGIVADRLTTVGLWVLDRVCKQDHTKKVRASGRKKARYPSR
jgi:hypothetical protein